MNRVTSAERRVVRGLRPAHAVWLLRRAAVLEGTSADAGHEPLDPARAAILRRVAAKITESAEGHTDIDLTPAERTLLATDAQDLTARAARELKSSDSRDLRHAEEWVLTARMLREILEATHVAPSHGR